MAGAKDDWRLFSFLDLPIFDLPFFGALEYQISAALNEDEDESTPMPSTVIETLNQSFSSLDLRYFDALEIQTSDASNEDKCEAPEKPFRFLDLPGEIRNLIYDLIQPSHCDKLDSVLFKPQVFHYIAPKSVSLDIIRWSCRQHQSYGWREGLCENVNCGEGAQNFMRLARVNQQIRKEVRSILYGRRDSCRGMYKFQTLTWQLNMAKRLYDNDDSATELYGLDRVERRAATKLGFRGVPFAVLKSFNGGLRSELLVPDWKGGNVSWGKLSDVKWTDGWGERACFGSRRIAEKEIKEEIEQLRLDESLRYTACMFAVMDACQAN